MARTKQIARRQHPNTGGKALPGTKEEQLRVFYENKAIVGRHKEEIVELQQKVESLEEALREAAEKLDMIVTKIDTIAEKFGHNNEKK